MTDSTAPVWVLGGGGITGIAWEIGMLTGFADEGVTVSQSAVLIGTSAGAAVAAQVASGVPMNELYERQFVEIAHDGAVGLTAAGMLRLAGASMLARDAEDGGRRIGRLAIDAHAEAGLLARIAARLPSHEWSDRDVRIVAVDTDSGVYRVFTRDDGAPLIDVVAASCAVPISTAPIEIEGRRYMDGGMRSTLNLDLAPGSGPVIALAPSSASIGRWASISRARAALGPARRVEIVHPDAASKRIRGSNVMDRTVVPALVAAAREQGRREADRVRAALA